MIELTNITKNYVRGAEQVQALRGIDLNIAGGEFIAIVGCSGSGKTTLLHILGCLDKPTSGNMRIDGADVAKLPEAKLVRIRRERIGFVFQQFYLIPGLTVFENIALPLVFNRKPKDRDRVMALIELVGLAHRVKHSPSQLSGGEMQRVAIARAMVNNPQVIVADEPTGNLDTATSEKIFALLQALHGTGLTIVMVTHNPDLAGRVGRVLEMKDGRIM